MTPAATAAAAKLRKTLKTLSCRARKTLAKRRGGSTRQRGSFRDGVNLRVCPGRSAAWSLKGVYARLRGLWRNDALQTHHEHASGRSLIQLLPVQPLRDYAEYIRIVRIRHWIVRISEHGSLRENHVLDVAAIFVRDPRKELVLFNEDAPAFQHGAGVCRVELLGNEIAPDQQNRMFGEFHKFCQRNFSPGGDSHTVSARYGRRQFAHRENWRGARFPADLTCERVCLPGNQ